MNPLLGTVLKLNRAEEHLHGMSPRARRAIERLQPYHRRKHPELRLLWMLAELSNIDKHRLVHTTGAVMRGTRFTLGGPGFLALERIEVFPGPIEENAVVARFYGNFDLEAGVDVEAHIAPDVTFDQRTEARSVKSWPVMEALVGIREVIAQRVIPEVEPGASAPVSRLGVDGRDHPAAQRFYRD